VLLCCYGIVEIWEGQFVRGRLEGFGRYYHVYHDMGYKTYIGNFEHGTEEGYGHEWVGILDSLHKKDIKGWGPKINFDTYIWKPPMTEEQK
jgi:hypothetical protein